MHLTHTVYLCFLYGSQNKRRLFPHTTLSDCFLKQRRSVFFCAVRAGYLTVINVQKFYILHTQCFYVFFYGSQNKQQLFPYTTLTDWFL